MFSERVTAAFYDAEDEKYRSFWDPEGSLHWGVFEPPHLSFIEACASWNEQMLAAARIDSSSRVLDLGCGNGTVSSWLAARTGAEVVGIDLSQTRINNANAALERAPQPRLAFVCGSATALPFEDGRFSHVFSQAVLYHTHDRERALSEASRVLAPGGLLVFDDLTTPRRPVGELARRYVYDRLLFEPTFSEAEYRRALERAGLVVFESRDLSQHLARSYRELALMAAPGHPELVPAYQGIPEVVAAGEVGWAFFLAQKVVDRLAWIYDTEDRRFTLRQKYDAWATRYDSDLGDSYAESPRVIAQLAARFLERNASVLDAGAGTGLVGEALHGHGFNRLTALDQSAGVLAVAAEKRVYARLVAGTLAEAVDELAGERFDAVTAVGVFTFAHASLDDLPALTEVLAPGGHLLLALRRDYYEMHVARANVLEKCGLREIHREAYFIFDAEPMLAFVLQKTA